MCRYAILLSLTLVLAACQGPGVGTEPAAPASERAGADAAASADDVAVRIEPPDDPRVGPAPVTVFLLEEGEGVEGAAVEVTGTMTHAGMAPIVARADPVEPGLYRAEGFQFSMAGDWILMIDATLADGRTRSAETVVSVRRP